MYDLIIEALAKLRDIDVIVNLKIAGTGPKENELKELTHKLNLGDQIEFTGLLTSNQLLSKFTNFEFYKSHY